VYIMLGEENKFRRVKTLFETCINESIGLNF